MLRRIIFWSGVVLLTAALFLMIAKQVAVNNLQKALSTYGGDQARIEGAQLYLDGLSVKQIEISDRLTLKNILFGRNVIKHIETMEITLDDKQNFLKTPLPFNLYDDLNIKFITLHAPFLDDVVSINGRLTTKEKSDGSTAYTLNFKTQEGSVRAKGIAEFDLKDQKINQMNIALEKGDSRYDWLQVKRATGWWDYNGKTQTQSGELTIGSLEWQDVILDNVQLSLTDQKITFAGDLLNKAGQVDGDISLESQQLSLAINAKDLSVFKNMPKGEGDIQTDLTLNKIDFKAGNFKGQGSVEGRLKTNKNTIDFDYKGALDREGLKITATPDECFNTSVSLKRGAVLLTIPEKQCFTILMPIVLSDGVLEKPIRFMASKTPYLFKNNIGTFRGQIFDLKGTVSNVEDISFNFLKTSVTSKPIKGVDIKNMNGVFYIGKGISAKNLSGDLSYQGHNFYFIKNGNGIAIKDKKTKQKIADLSGGIKNNYYFGKTIFNGPLSLLDKDATAGQAFYNGLIGFDVRDPFAGVAGEGILKITDGSIKKGDLQTNGVYADIQVQSIKPFSTKEGQMVELKEGILGAINFKNGVAYFDKKKSQPLNIQSVQFNAMGGVWRGAGKTITSEVIIDNILQGSNFSGLTVTPKKLTAQINLEIKDSGVNLKNSVFKSKGSGKISYNLNDRPVFLNAGADHYNLQRMRDILQDFQFSELAVPVNKIGVQGLYILGIHPDYNNGKPIEFDLTVN